MRVSNQAVSRNYLRRLETNYSNKFNSERKIAGFRQYDEASEMPAQAATAMRVRKAIANLNTYQENLKTADNIYSNAESSVTAISEIIQLTYEKCIEAANGTSSDVHTHSPDQMEMIAVNVEAYADEIARLMNLSVADRKIFGGVNNDEKAFSIENGRVIYNGVDVDTYNDPTMFPNSVVSYCDIGLGMTLDQNGRVDEQSALPITFNGVEVIGCGKAASTAYIDLASADPGALFSFELTIGDEKHVISFNGGVDSEDTRDNINAELDKIFNGKVSVYENGMIFNQLNDKPVTVRSINEGGNVLSVENQSNEYSNNIIQSILDAAQMIREGNGKEIAKYADHIYSLQTTVSLALAKIGTQTKFIEFNQTRITNNLENMGQRQNDLEALVDTSLAAEITNRDMLDSLYTATLQMSASVIPQSIFNFI
ncbi:MAG: hypothetical protein HDT44_10530 [Ruminococcaceae bacterium]|nr:hypothetical protein [Oscillospiraceae bacterium]